MHSVTISDMPGQRLAGIEARLRPSRLAWCGAALPVIAGTLALALHHSASGASLLLIGLLLLVGVGLYGSRGGAERAPLEAGVAAEQAVRQALAGLDDRYYLLNGLRLPEGQVEIDHLLLGPRGLFVLETKAHGGSIVYAEGSWLRLQPGANGVLQRRQIGDPAAQVQRNARALRLYLAAQLGAWARALPLVPIVVFTHPHITLEVYEGGVAIVRLTDLAPLLRLYGEDRLAPAEVSRILALLTERENAGSSSR